MTAPLNNLTDTWNNGATVFTGLKYNITNTASAAGSLVFDFQLGGGSVFRLGKSGNLYIENRGFAAVGIGTDPSNSGFSISIAGDTSSTCDYYFSPSSGGRYSARVRSDAFYAWASGTSAVGTPDLFLGRDAAGIMAQRDGTNAQTLRVYNTYTDASNYERGVFDWTTTSNTLTIGSQAAGTGTARSVILVGSVIALTNGAGNRMLETDNAAAVLWIGTAGANYDLGISRSVSGVLEINSGSVGTYRELKLRSLLCNGVTVANLPGSPTAGQVAYVTDATATTIGSTVAGTGSNKVMVWYNGTNWHIMAN